MKLEHKAGLSVLGVLAVMTGVVSLILTQVVRQSYTELELRQAQMQIDGVKRALDQEMEDLSRAATDYGDWDDITNYLAGTNASFVDDNFDPDSLRNLRVDHALVFTDRGDYRDGRSPHDGKSEATPATRAMAEQVKSLVTALIAAGNDATSRASVMSGPAGLLLVVAHPTTPADENARFPGGVLVFARNLDEAVVTRLAQLQGVPVRIDREHTDEFIRREGGGSQTLEGDRVNVSASDDWLLGHFPLSDWRGQVVGWVHVEMNRVIYRQGVRMSWLLVGVVVVTGVVFSGLIVWLLRHLVTRRLQRTCDQLAAIEAGARPEARLMPEGEDELARLAGQINAMLDAIEHAQEERAKRDRQQRLLERQLQQAQKLEVVGTFAGGIAHDFNNYLAAVKGWVNLAQMAARDGQLRPDYLEQAERALTQGSLLTKQLLLFSRRELPQLVEVFVGNLMRESTDLIRMAVPRTVTIQVDILSDACVRIDPGQFQQVLLNLAVNASDAMAGEGALTFNVRAQRMPHAEAPGSLALKPGPYVWLQVIDTGSGVPSHILPRIFEPFFTTKTSDKGTGLGLAVVQRIIEGSGGAIEVQTLVGRGTTFHLYLPAVTATTASPGMPMESATIAPSSDPVAGAPSALGALPSAEIDQTSEAPREEQPTAPSASLASTGQSPASPAETLGRVLLVDDDQMVCAVWREVFTLAGYTFTTRSDGEQAWQLLQQPDVAFDVIVVDHVMPRMDGMELSARARVAFPQLPVILLTAVLPMAASDLETRGFFGVLTKPVGVDEMVEIVARAVAQRRRTGE